MKILQKICIVLLLISFSSVCVGKSFKSFRIYSKGQGKVCFDGKNSDFETCQREAEQGDAISQFNLGWMYDKREGVPQGSDSNLYDHEVVKWYTKSAEQGFPQAQFNLGNMYSDGQGVPQDYREAVKWYRKSAEQGYVEAQYNLGVMYVNGEGVVQDYKEAVKWFRKSAEQGLAQAQYNLGFAYVQGKGVPKNYVMAHMYWGIAAVSGNKSAIKNIGIVEEMMTPLQIEKAQDLAREWMQTHQ